MIRPVNLFFLAAILLHIFSPAFGVQHHRGRSFLVTLDYDKKLTVYNVKGDVFACLADEFEYEPRVLQVRDLMKHVFPLILESLDRPCSEASRFLGDEENDWTDSNKTPATMGRREYLEAPLNSVSFTNLSPNEKLTTPMLPDPRPLPIIKYLNDKLDDTNQPTYQGTVHVKGPWPVARYGPIVHAAVPRNSEGLDLKKRAAEYHYKVNSFAGSSVS